MDSTPMRSKLPVVIISSVLLLLGAAPPGRAAVEVVASVEFDEPVDWYFESDIGMLHLYGADKLRTVDLLERGRSVHDPIHLPGADEAGAVIHLPATPYLFVSAADSGLKAPERDGGPTSSYLIDTFTGSLLWEGPPRTSVVDVFILPFEDRFVLRTGKKGDKLTGLTLSSGEEKWTLSIPGKAVWAEDSVLQIIGEQSASIDAVSGVYLRRITIPVSPKDAVTPVRGTDRVVVWRGDDFSAYSIPRLDASARPAPGSEPTVAATLLWNYESKKKTPTKLCREADMPCGPQLVPGNRLLLNGIARVELLDFATGEVIWSRKEQALVRATAVSPSGRHGAIPGTKTLTVIDMATGEDIGEIRYPQGAKPKIRTEKPGAYKAFAVLMSRVVWPTDDEVVVILQNKKGKPRGLMRFNAAKRELLWGRDLPSPADYPMTTGERGKLFGRIFLSLALTFASAANPISVGGSSYYYVFTPDWRVRSSPDLGFDPYSPPEFVQRPIPEWLRKARQRYRRRIEFFQEARDRDTVFVTGRDGDYALESLDLKTGELETLGTHRGSPIHSIEPDSVYRLAVSLERQKKTLRLLSLSDPDH